MPVARQPFETVRPRLQGLAYRMLGSRADAEDIVQDTWLRWQSADRERIEDPEAWLMTTASRLCIDRLRARQRERELYVGPWLPEPWIGREPPTPDQQAELADDLSLAFLALLERLAPDERAAFLLREVFACDYARIAELLGRSEAACRQVVHRAGERVRRERRRFQASNEARQLLLQRFADATAARDEDALLALFAPDATWTADGGGKVTAARRVVHGRRSIVRLALGLAGKYWRGTAMHLCSLNGEAALRVEVDGRLVSALAIATDGRSILALYGIVNPDKLQALRD